MTTDITQIRVWLQRDEDEGLEFKEAKTNFRFEKAVQYCVALANEGGGKLILGVTDKHPRRVVGSQAFANLSETKLSLLQALHFRVDIEEIFDENQERILIFHIPSRPVGTPLHYRGTYLMRSGESIEPMTTGQISKIIGEGVTDFSASICGGATIQDLSQYAIKELQRLWREKSRQPTIDTLEDQQVLQDLGLMVEENVTYAALILLGKAGSLRRLLPQTEVIFEYRSDEVSIEHQERFEYRSGFLLYQNDLWEQVNLRNDKQHVQEGFFSRDIPTFNEQVIREAILNAVSHRSYQDIGSVFVRQYPHKLRVESPGGFPEGIDETNILKRQKPRNRLIAEVLTKCGLVERSGQGVDKMFRESLREGKALPDYSDSDEYQVNLSVFGIIQNPKFLQFLEEVGNEQLITFGVGDLLVLNAVHKDKQIPSHLRDNAYRLVEKGVLERTGQGRGTKYILSRRFYHYLEQGGTYTRKRGLDRETNKELLLKHIHDNLQEGSRFKELKEVLPMLQRREIQGLLQELREEGKIYLEGRTRGARWYPKQEPNRQE
ncbi:MAG: ATP-binding protein [Trueperaceae bacterium]|nr:ATP-binding protein [Trueperaceae bacterium]